MNLGTIMTQHQKGHDMTLQQTNGASKRKRRHYDGKPPLAVLRVPEIDRLFIYRYGAHNTYVLPDDDAGRDDAFIMCCHLARCPNAPASIRARWLSMRTPWMSEIERKRMLARPVLTFRADTLASRLGVTYAVRQELGLHTIGALDMTKAEREAARKLRARERESARRRARGAKPQAESLSRTKPWEAAGMSRATWYRRLRQLPAQYGRRSLPLAHEVVSRTERAATLRSGRSEDRARFPAVASPAGARKPTQASVRFGGETLEQRRREPRLTDPGLAGQEDYLAFAGFAFDHRRSSSSSSSSRPTSSVNPLPCRASKRLSTALGRSAAQARTGSAIPLRSLAPRS